MAATMFKALPPGRPVAPLIEFLHDLVYFTTSVGEPAPRDGVVFFSIDTKLTYNSFYLDFGPHNLGCTFQFCVVMNKMVASADQLGRKVVFFSSATDAQLRANAVCLLTCWGVLFQGMTPERAFSPFERMPLPPFHDASPTTCDFKLCVLDCLRGLTRAVASGYLRPHAFDLVEYHHYEQVENGDLTWVSPKFIAFAGPQNEYALSPEGYVMLTPEHYVPYFKKRNVTLVVRLNEKLYDEKRFTRAGIAHIDLFYPDGANPPEAVLLRFLQACEKTPGAVAVHCKAGLGRTGTCIAAYLMKHARFTAKEVIGWLRLCRPGSVIGPQQEYVESIQHKMWQLGERAAQEEVAANAVLETEMAIAGSKTTSRACTAVKGRATTSTQQAAPVAPPVLSSPKSPRLLSTRSINIYGVRRSVDLSSNPVTSNAVAALRPAPGSGNDAARPTSKLAPTQGDQLLQRKQQYQQGFYVR